MLLRNVEHHKNKLNKEKIISDFEKFDEEFRTLDAQGQENELDSKTTQAI